MFRSFLSVVVLSVTCGVVMLCHKEDRKAKRMKDELVTNTATTKRLADQLLKNLEKKDKRMWTEVDVACYKLANSVGE